MRYRYSWKAVAIPFLFLGLTHGALAQSVTNFEAAAGVSFSDNLFKASVNEQDATIFSAEVGLTSAYESRMTKVDLAAKLRQFLYSGIDADDETLGDVQAALQFNLIPERLKVNITENLGQRTIDPFRADNPANRENLNVFGVAPELVVLDSQRDQLLIRSEYSDVRYSKSAEDYSKLLGGVVWNHNFSKSRSMLVSAETERVDYESIDFGDSYDVQTLFLQFNSATSLSELALAVGYNEIHVATLTQSGLFARLAWNRKLSDTRSVEVAGGRQFSDAGQAFADRQRSDLFPSFSDDVFSVGDSFERTFFTVSLVDSDDTRTSVIRLFFDDREYQLRNEFDQYGYGIDYELDRRITETSSVLLGARYAKRDFVPTTDDNIEFSIAYRRGLTRTVSLLGSYDFSSRTSLIDKVDYDENRLGLSVVANW